jgi:hypothetical protein
MANKKVENTEVDVFDIMENIIKERETKEEKESSIKTVPFLKVCIKCEEKIDGDVSETAFKRYLDKYITVKDYIPLSYKKNLLDIFFSSIESEDGDFSDLAYLFEMFTVLHILMFYTNIEIDVTELTEENYDLVVHSGLADYIKSKCEKDFNKTYSMAMQAISFKTYEIISNFANTVDIDGARDLFADTQNAVSEIDIEKLRFMKDIMDYNNPALKDVKDAIYDETRKIIETKQKKE